MVQKSLYITHVFAVTQEIEHELPLLLARISAGFPSPADDYIDQKLDLNRYLIKHPAATFFVRVEGASMIDAGIHSGDLLIVDRAVAATDQKVVVAYVNGEFTVKRLCKKGARWYLMPEARGYEPIEVTSEMNIQVWGVVTYVIHPVT